MQELLILFYIKEKLGDTYNIGGFNEWKNIDLIKMIIKIVDRMLGREEGLSEKLITYVTDRMVMIYVTQLTLQN